MLSREGYSTIIVVLLFSIVTAAAVSFLDHWSKNVIYAFLFILCGLVIYFFRDPERDTPGDENLVIAPADGKVVRIKSVRDPYFREQDVTQISIFLSVLDVHVNRVPVAGKLELVNYYPGRFLMAWEDGASELNEQAHFGIVHPSGRKFLFKQITGFLARRIVYHIGEGDSLKAGERFGVMKFGSRMDILIPEGVDIRVREGDRTVAGESILGVITS